MECCFILFHTFFLEWQWCNDTNTYGLPSNNCAPPIIATKAFEEDLVHMNESVSFRKVNYPFLNMIKKDIQKVNSSENVFIFADKTRNLYEASPSTYNTLLTENITKAGTEDIIDSSNVELKDIANSI